jgi:cell division protein ZapA
MTSTTLDITLQGREFRVACAPDEREDLLAAVALLETRMNEMAAQTRASGERLAMMAALNLAHELTSLKKEPPPLLDTPDARRRIKSMEARLDAALAEQEKLF